MGGAGWRSEPFGSRNGQVHQLPDIVRLNCRAWATPVSLPSIRIGLVRSGSGRGWAH